LKDAATSKNPGDDEDSDDGAAFGITYAERASDEWKKMKKEGEFPTPLKALFEAAEESEIVLRGSMLNNEILISEINKHFATLDRKPIALITDLKAAPASIVAKAFKSGDIAF